MQLEYAVGICSWNMQLEYAVGNALDLDSDTFGDDSGFDAALSDCGSTYTVGREQLLTYIKLLIPSSVSLLTSHQQNKLPAISHLQYLSVRVTTLNTGTTAAMTLSASFNACFITVSTLTIVRANNMCHTTGSLPAPIQVSRMNPVQHGGRRNPSCIAWKCFLERSCRI